jgi:2-keto-3-deoxy-L-rhamnonate aldolase RhmA
MRSLAELVHNPLKAKLRAGQVVTSMIVRMARGPETSQIAASAGLDALYVDLEHSPLNLETTAIVCTSAWDSGITPLVRLPSNDTGLIGRVLDLGAMGVIVPQIESAEDARLAVKGALYPPLGNRSVSSSLPVLAYRNFPVMDAAKEINEQILVVAMIESQAGLDRCEEIAAVDGIDLLFVGTHDLSVQLGIAGGADKTQINACIERVVNAAKSNGKSVGLGGMAADPDALTYWTARGVQFISVGSDLGFVMQGASLAVKQIMSVTKASGSEN